MFARELRESCDYARYGTPGGYFDGTLAFRMTYAKLFSGERTKSDREFYCAAEQLQRSSRLADGCKAEDFMAKAFAWIYRIRPHLAQAYTDQDAAEFLVDMVPKRLASDARRIRSECIREGTFLNLMHVARELEKVIFDDQSKPATTAAAVAVPADLQKYDVAALSHMCGMTLTNGALDKSDIGLAGDVGEGKWCDRCPHRPGVTCFLDPAYKGPFPVSVHLNAERKKALLKGKAENARKAGVKNERVANPTQAAIDEYNSRQGGRGRGGGRGGGRGKGRGDKDKSEDTDKSADADKVAAAVAVERDSFYDNLVDINDAAFCAIVADRSSPVASSVASPLQPPTPADGHAVVETQLDFALCVIAQDAEADSTDVGPELTWYVVTDPSGALDVRAAVRASHLELPVGATSVQFGNDEARARQYLESQKINRGAVLPSADKSNLVPPMPMPTLPEMTPSAPLAPLAPPSSTSIAAPPPLPTDAAPPPCSVVAGTITPAPSQPQPHAMPTLNRSAVFASSPESPSIGDLLGPAPPPPTGDDAEALIQIVAITPAPPPRSATPPRLADTQPRVERRVESPPPTELPPQLAPRAPIAAISPSPSPSPPSPPSSPLDRPPPEPTHAERAAAKDPLTPSTPPPRTARSEPTPSRLVTFTFLAIGLVACITVYSVTSHFDFSAAVGVAAAGIQIHAHRHGVARVSAALERAISFIGEHAVVVLFGIFLVFAARLVHGSPQRPSAVIHPVGSATFLPPPSPPSSPPPSPPPVRDDHLASRGLRAPRADLFTADQAGSLYLELLGGNEPPAELPASARCLVVGDTGCGRSMGNNVEQFERGTLVEKSSSILGVGGSMTTKLRGSLRVPVLTEHHGMGAYKERDAILNEKCPFVLLALGRASIEQGVTSTFQPGGSTATSSTPTAYVSACSITTSSSFVQSASRRTLSSVLHPSRPSQSAFPSTAIMACTLRPALGAAVTSPISYVAASLSSPSTFAWGGTVTIFSIRRSAAL